MGWEIFPESIYHMLKKFSAYEGVKKIIVSESGMALHDKVENGIVNDERRISYLQSHLEQVLKAKNEGVNVKGFFVWTLLDNFEWAEGYHPRFGLVHIDFETQQRTIKDSGYWYNYFLSQ
jgi:beta-glucosidase